MAVRSVGDIVQVGGDGTGDVLGDGQQATLAALAGSAGCAGSLSEGSFPHVDVAPSGCAGSESSEDEKWSQARVALLDMTIKPFVAGNELQNPLCKREEPNQDLVEWEKRIAAEEARQQEWLMQQVGPDGDFGASHLVMTDGFNLFEVSGGFAYHMRLRSDATEMPSDATAIPIVMKAPRPVRTLDDCPLRPMKAPIGWEVAKPYAIPTNNRTIADAAAQAAATHAIALHAPGVAPAAAQQGADEAANAAAAQAAALRCRPVAPLAVRQRAEAVAEAAVAVAAALRAPGPAPPAVQQEAHAAALAALAQAAAVQAPGPAPAAVQQYADAAAQAAAALAAALRRQAAAPAAVRQRVRGCRVRGVAGFAVEEADAEEDSEELLFGGVSSDEDNGSVWRFIPGGTGVPSRWQQQWPAAAAAAAAAPAARDRSRSR